MSAIERFMAKVCQTDSCWIWTAFRNEDGYGRFMVSGKVRSAHRFIYEHTFGSIPPGRVVCHRCDIRACVNPAHLFIGTQLENISDALHKGRMGKKLSIKQVKEILQLIADGLTNTEISKRFGTCHQNISNIRRGLVWRQVSHV